MKYYMETCVILCAVFVMASALKCYDSESGSTVTCNGSCVTITSFKDGKVSTIQKHCWSEKEEDKCTTDDIMGIKTESCYCNEDGCNPSSTPRLFGLLLFVPFIIRWL
ncbi:uncharacterized protein [Palaemon carinicauda]|uniref:uncharacterized protein n=1 Tax=Palaemon carinicauda TaxID=392227 RepID=UPI0035B65253